jgi:hypothetical protein
MLYIAFWKSNVKDLRQVIEMERKGKLTYPQGVKSIGNYVMPDASGVEIIEAEDEAKLFAYIGAWLPWMEYERVHPAMTAKEAIDKRVFE